MKTLSTILLILISYNLIQSQQVGFHPYNLDFEIGESNRMPYSWELTKNSADNDYIAYATNKITHSGNRALLLFNQTEYKQGMYGTVYQRFDANRYRGKKVKFSANIKTDLANDSSEVRLFINEYNRNRKSNQVEMMGENPITKADYENYEIEITISKDAFFISIGFTLLGIGNLYVDNVKFEVIDDINYEIVDKYELNDKQIDNILNFGKIYSYAKYYQSTSQIQNLNHYNFLRYGISQNIETENQVSTLKNLFNSITPNLQINNNNEFQAIELNQEQIKDFSILYKHRVLFNDCYPTISQSEIKNIYAPDKSKQGFMMRNIKHLGLQNKELVFSARAKADLINLYSDAQLWLRVFRGNEPEINVYMQENPITSNQWKEYNISQVIPDDATEIKVGCVLNGDGTVWFDDIKFSVRENGKLIELENGLENFDNYKIGEIPKDWSIPYSVSQLGYEFYVDDTYSSSKNNSMKITTENTHIINYPNDNELVTIKINDSLFINYPITHHINQTGTLPNVDPEQLNNFLTFIESHNIRDNDFYSQIATITEIYVNLKHFYIYEDLDPNLDIQFKNTLKKFSKNELSFNQSMRYLTSFLKDSQINFWKINDENSFSFPFSVNKIGEDYIVTELYEKESEIKIGDKLLKINNVDFDELVKNELKLRPGINENYKTIKAISSYMLDASKDSTKIYNLEFESGKKQLKKNKIPSDYLNTENFDLAKPEENILYVNMAMVEDKFFKYLVDEIADIEGIIFDARGNTLLSEHFLGYFLDNEVPTNQSRIPYYVHPDKNKISYEVIQPNLQKLSKNITKNIVFLIDENTIGYTEFVMYLVKYYNLGTLIGRNTVGMAHDVVSIPLPLDYNFSMSVFDIYSPNKKSSLSFKVIEPDIYVEQNSDLERDHILEKSIEFLKNKSKDNKWYYL